MGAGCGAAGEFYHGGAAFCSFTGRANYALYFLPSWFVYGRLQPDAVRRVRRRACCRICCLMEKQDALRHRPSGCCCAPVLRRRSAFAALVGGMPRRSLWLTLWDRVIRWQRSSGKNKEERPAQRAEWHHRAQAFLFAFCAKYRHNDPKTTVCGRA